MIELPVPRTVLRRAETAVYLGLIDEDASREEIHSACQVLKRLVRQGRLRPIRLSGKLEDRFVLEELERFCRAETERTADEGDDDEGAER